MVPNSSHGTKKTLEHLVKSGRGNQQWLSIFSRLKEFLRSIGDHVSRILLLSRCPKHCPPQDPRGLVLFMRWHVYQGQILDTDGVTILKDVCGNEIIGKGSWRKHSPLKQFKSAISSLHHYRGFTGGWSEPCNACIEEESGEIKNGCSRHTGHKLIENTGNPVDSEVFKAEYRKLDALVIHDVDSAKALNPFH